MHKREISIWIAAACCAAGLMACGDDSGDDEAPAAGTGVAGTLATAGSGGMAGAAGSAGAGRGGAGGAGGSSGASGSSGAGGTAGSAGGDNDAGVDDEDAGAPPDLTENMARALITGFGAGTVTGSATFTESGIDVTVVVMLSNCPDGVHPVHIHQGTSCADANAQGMHWDTTRGEGIPDVTCANGVGMVTYTRPGTPGAVAWSVMGSATTDVIGHAFVVHAANNDRIGCGVIIGMQ